MDGDQPIVRRKGRPPKDPEKAAERAAAAAAVEAKQPRGVKRKRMFTRELQAMMYGFGDVSNPLPESIDLLEDMVVEYVVEMTQKALQLTTKKGKDQKRHDRALELLRMSEELKRARASFEEKDIIKDATSAKDKEKDLDDDLFGGD
ncbi:transcription initiation factor tfiid subunit 13, putative [Acanthamoeba castellanii str. Neff]|uniref:Transcription initiation factor TFIID subunit 13 n=1 Tax=Acanthamoeba castellanii (strain ATCC 30010 / Neff) TaxID=1257118 RepID=L8GP29_ACACF|nr:transcription initiation factor tfiid subunit 13, putative [Acanthamoeba castellanii str. Neff]ELR14637.1 transcription initiation factor tfiid subunit 13, putative [Acanthamoeba castellanii str. Neff]